MTRRRRRTVFTLDCLEGRLSLDGTCVAVMAPQLDMLPDTAVYGTVPTGDVAPSDPSDGLPDPTDPGSNDGQLPFSPLDPAPLNPAGPV